MFGQLLNQRSKRTSKSIKTKKKQKAARILKGKFQKKRDRFNPEKTERGGGLICLGFFQKCVFQTKCEALFFVTFNNILSHIFPENFIEFPQIVQKI